MAMAAGRHRCLLLAAQDPPSPLVGCTGYSVTSYWLGTALPGPGWLASTSAGPLVGCQNYRAVYRCLALQLHYLALQYLFQKFGSS